MQSKYVILYFLSLILGGAGAWFIYKFGKHLGLLDRPNDRSSHQVATPKGGGIGILLSFLIVSLVMGIPKSFWIPAVLLSITSFIGDRFGLSPWFRLLSQFTACMVLLGGLWYTKVLLFDNFLLIFPLSAFIVGTANYYNFMDGINGIAGIAGIVGFGLLSYYNYLSETGTSMYVLTICLAMSCLGFLPFNMPRAKVFMGDVGSILLGFIFAVMVIWNSSSLTQFLCLTCFLFPFYADEITTELIRLKEGEKLWIPHRKHLYQLLVNEHNIDHWKISIGYGIVQLFIGINILMVRKSRLWIVALLIFLYFIIFTIVSSTLRKRLVHKSGI